MFFRKFINSILILTLFIQLFPTNQAGRFFMMDLPDDECADMPSKGNQLRQFVEEEHKDIHIEHNWVSIPFINITRIRVQYSESLPSPHPGAIPTPPPNFS